MFRAVRRDAAQLRRIASVSGTVACEDTARADLLVVAHAPGASDAADVYTLLGPGRYVFALPAGVYRVVAFEDANRDRAFQPETERRSPVTMLDLAEGEQRGGVDLQVSRAVSEPLQLPRLLDPEGRRVNGLPDVQVGTVTALDAPRFATRNGTRGMWEPVAFLFEVGAGLYVLEPCDEARTPVLFVHGIGGSPAEFAYLAGTLDRTRFQPWFVFHPSGLELDRIADGLARWMQVMHTRCPFERLLVVAHSMGGLVARAFIDRATAGALPPIGRIETFVSIATPWGGHSAAALGVAHAPAVVPAWRDLVPGSAFLETLLATPLPPGLRFHLFFGFRGRRSPFLRGANDGAVTLASQLDPRAQRAAIKLYGYDETHRGILESPDVAAQLRSVLGDE